MRSVHYSSYSGHSKFREQRLKIVGTTALDCKSFTSYVALQTKWHFTTAFRTWINPPKIRTRLL